MKEVETRIGAAYAAGRIDYQHCPACGHDQAFARPFCLRCLRPDPDWRAAAGDGVVVACTTVHRAPTPEWKERLPYAIALIDLSEGLRIMALADPSLRAGDPARLRPGGAHELPFFEPMVTK